MKFRICWNISVYLVVTELNGVSKKTFCKNVLLLTKCLQGKASSVMSESPMKNRKKNTLGIAKNYDHEGLTFQSLVCLSQISDLRMQLNRQSRSSQAVEISCFHLR